MTNFRITDSGDKTIDRYTIWFLEDGCLTGDYIATSGYPGGFYQHGHSGQVDTTEPVLDISELPADCYLALLKEFQEER